MPTQLQLEGRELEPLLDRVRTELGPGARILQAEKVRIGGIGGFFARQRFELTVEVDEAAAAAAQAAAPTPEAAAAPAAPTSLLDLADQVSADEHAAAVSTEAPSFSSLLSRLGAAIGSGTPAAAAPTGAAAPTAGVPVQRRSTDGPPAAAQAAAAGPALPDWTAAVTSAVAASTPATTPSAPAATPSASAFQVAQFQAASAPTTPLPGTEAVPAEAGAPSPSATTAAVVPSRPSTVVRSSTVATQAGSATSSAVAVRPSAEVAMPVTGSDLARLGLPAHLRPAESGDDLYPALVESLRQLPKVPRTANRAGGVLAVVGPLPLAVDVAREIAREMGLSVGTSVFLATAGRVTSDVGERQRIRDLDTAQVRRAAWRRRRGLTIVAVDAALTGAGAAQARDYLSVLEPTATWGVVEATRKAQDVGTWARALGGVHALALAGVEETSDPAAVLELGIPVGRLGGRAATPAVWASLLTGRLAA